MILECRDKNKGPKLQVSALLLAGGGGVRMGGNKLFLSDGESWILEKTLERLSLFFDEIVLCCGADQQDYPLAFNLLLNRFAVHVVRDRLPGKGPLEGLRQGLAAMHNSWGFLLGCDMPSVQEAVVRQMWALTPNACQVSVMRLDNYLMPLHAFYHQSCLCCVDDILHKSEPMKKGEGNLKSFYRQINLNVIEEARIALLPGYRRSFMGCNTPEELREIFLQDRF